MEGKLKCVAVDDDPLMLAILGSFVNRTEDIEIVGEYHNYFDAVTNITRIKKVENGRGDADSVKSVASRVKNTQQSYLFSLLRSSLTLSRLLSPQRNLPLSASL